MGSIPAIVRWLRVQPCGEKPAETSKELPHESVLLERSFCVLIEVLTLETDFLGLKPGCVVLGCLTSL